MKTFQKTIRREFKNSLGRFVSISAIIALSVGFVLGLLLTPTAMQRAADRMFDVQNIYDIQFKSNVGFVQADIDRIAADERVTAVIGAVTADVVIRDVVYGELSARLYAYPDATLNGEPDAVNRVVHTPDSILPQSAGECLVERAGNTVVSPAIGSTVTIVKANSEQLYHALRETELTVTGVSESAMYFDRSAFETTAVGNGKLSAVLYAPLSLLPLSFPGYGALYTDLFVTVKPIGDGNCFTVEYTNAVQDISDDLTKVLSEQAEPVLPVSRSVYALDRQTNGSYMNYYTNTDKVKKIAAIFPAFFLFVAALVALTTMTRMVDEDRHVIGTLKALGYGKGRIASKYLVYCFVATMLGITAGLAIGYTLLPNIIYSIFGSTCYLPALGSGFSWWPAVLIAGGSLLLTMGVTLGTVLWSLRERASELLRPRAPKPGQRILLERVGFIWNRLSFKYKATVRNLMRHKKQFLLTVVGVAGCVALLMAGFGLRDSVTVLTDTQYTNILLYDYTVHFDADNAAAADLERHIAENSESHMAVYFEYTYAKTAQDRFKTSVYVFDPVSDLQSFVSLHGRGGDAFPIHASTCIMSEKMADLLEVQSGDSFLLTLSGEERTLTLSGVAENYLDSFVYLSSEMYADAADSAAPPSNLYLIRGATDGQTVQALNALEGVGGITLKADLKQSYASLLRNIVQIVYMLIFVAGGLCLIVLYNLTNISIGERKKELSTLKVLGYHTSEVGGYVFRESIIMTVIGILFGLGLGVLLHKYLLLHVDAFNLMLGQRISWLGYVLSAVITAVFAVGINLIMLPRIKKVNMSESMKSDE